MLCSDTVVKHMDTFNMVENRKRRRHGRKQNKKIGAVRGAKPD